MGGRFFGRPRPKFLGLDEIGVPPAPVQPIPVPRQKPEEMAVAEAVPESLIEDSPEIERPSGTKLAIAKALMERGDQGIPEYGSWVNGLDNLAASVGGAYMARKGEEDQLAYEQKQAEMLSSALSSGDDDAYGRYISSLAKTDPKKAMELNAARLAAADKARIEAKYKVPTRISRDRASGGTTYQEESFDGGQTWREYGNKPTHAPSSADPSRAPAGYEWYIDPETGERRQRYIKGGPGDPATKPDNNEQSLSFSFGTRMADNLPTLSDPQIMKELMNPVYLGWTEWTPDIISNYRVSNNFRRGYQAVRDFVNAILRRESGAAISAGEFTNAFRQYIPRPGDDKDTLAQKARNRQTAVYTMFVNAGPKYTETANRFKPVQLATDPNVDVPGLKAPRVGAPPPEKFSGTNEIPDGHVRPNPKDPTGATVLRYDASKKKYFKIPNPKAPKR